MSERLLRPFARAVATRRRLVFGVCGILCALSAATLPWFEFRTARSAVKSSNDPDQARFDQFLKELGPESVVLAAWEGTEADRRGFIEEVVATLRREAQAGHGPVGEVFDRIPTQFFLERGAGLAPALSLELAAAELSKQSPLIAALGQARGLADLHAALLARMESEMRSGQRPEKEETTGLAILSRLLALEGELIRQPLQAVQRVEDLELARVFELAAFLAPGEPGLLQLARGGHLAAADGSLYIALVSPRNATDDVEKLRAFLSEIARAATSAKGKFPAVAWGRTGVAVTVVEEADSVARDGPLTALIAVGGIALLVTVAFARRRAVPAIFLALGVAVLWTFAFTWLVFGGFNLITSAVPVILIALGIDSGLHVVNAYEERRRAGLAASAAAEDALVRVGPGLLTGAVTAALAFFAICFMEYRGFREFGVISGGGVLACLAAMTTLLPALLVATDRRATPATSPSPVEARPGARERLGGLLVRAATAFPRLSLVAAASVTVWFVILARGIGFDYRVEDLLPGGSEAIAVQNRLRADQRLTPEFAIVFAKDRAELEGLDQKAQGEPLIARRESILSAIPSEPVETRARAMARVGSLLEPLVFDAERVEKTDPKTFAASLASLREGFEKALDLVSTQGGFSETKRTLETIVTTIEGHEEFLAGSIAFDWAEQFTAAQSRLWKWIAARRGDVARMLERGPVTESDLPREIVSKLKGVVSDRYALYLYPKEDVIDRGALERFVAAARRVHPEATGYPVVFFAATSLIHRGFDGAVTAAAVVIALALLIHFRKPTQVVLAALPKVIGIVWMLGIMRLLGINYNLANQIVIPLLVGVGLSFGIHLVHGYFQTPAAERSVRRLLSHTGDAVLLSGLTTMIGFGSLSLATHRGMASMGLVLFFGVGSALLASTWVLASVLAVMEKRSS